MVFIAILNFHIAGLLCIASGWHIILLASNDTETSFKRHQLINNHPPHRNDDDAGLRKERETDQNMGSQQQENKWGE